MKILILIFIFINSYALEFEEKSLKETLLQGLEKKIVYKNEVDKKQQVDLLWEEFLSSKSFEKIADTKKNIYLVYSNYKKNSFDCFIAVQNNSLIYQFTKKVIKEKKYNYTKAEYSQDITMDKVWNDISKVKLKRDYQADILIFNTEDIYKETYSIDIYLSKKQ